MSRNWIFGRFLLRLSRIKPSQVIFMVKFCRTVLNFGYDFVLLVHFFWGHPVHTYVQAGFSESELPTGSGGDGAQLQALRHCSSLPPRLDPSPWGWHLPWQRHRGHGRPLPALGQVQLVLLWDCHGNGSCGSSLWSNGDGERFWFDLYNLKKNIRQIQRFFMWE